MYSTTYVFSSSSKKEAQGNPISTTEGDLVTDYMTRYVRIIATNSQQKKQITRDTTQPTNNIEHT